MAVYYNCTNTALAIGRGKADLLPGKTVSGDHFNSDKLMKLVQKGVLRKVDHVPEIEVSTSEEGGQTEVFGKFRYTPEQLEGKSLEQLNSMVAEINPEIEEFETVEEAVAQLGSDL